MPNLFGQLHLSRKTAVRPHILFFVHQGKLRSPSNITLYLYKFVVNDLQGLQNFRCALCRTEFPNAVLDQPDLVMPMDASTSTVDQNEHRWFYEGRNGWWQFDERTSQDIEDAYKNGDRHCTIFVAGYLYVVDFDQMLQLRLNDQLRKRKVKRDLVSTPKLGIAGLLTPDAST